MHTMHLVEHHIQVITTIARNRRTSQITIEITHDEKRMICILIACSRKLRVVPSDSDGGE